MDHIKHEVREERKERTVKRRKKYRQKRLLKMNTTNYVPKGRERE